MSIVSRESGEEEYIFSDEIIFPRGLVLGLVGNKLEDFLVVINSIKKGYNTRVETACLEHQDPNHCYGHELLSEIANGKYEMLYGTDFARFIRDPRLQRLKTRHNLTSFLRDDSQLRNWLNRIDQGVMIVDRRELENLKAFYSLLGIDEDDY